MFATSENSFWDKVDRRADDECWPWNGYRNPAGYGRLRVAGAHIMAPRRAWEIANDATWPADKIACHTCDNPPCVNPKHIWPGTHAENHRDCREKGRWSVNAQGNKECARGHPLRGDNVVAFEGYYGCRVCLSGPAPTFFGHEGVCKKCGHFRTDDYLEKGSRFYPTGPRPVWKCRRCNHKRAVARVRARAGKAA